MFQPGGTVRLIQASGQFAEELAQGQAEIGRSSQAFAAPEGNQGRCSLGRGDQDPIGLDLLQAPGVGAQQKDVADAALVDELFVQLADADAIGGVGGILAGVGDGAAADQGQVLTAGQSEETIVDAIPV